MRISKKKILLGAPATLLPLLSLQAFAAAVTGYFLAEFFAGNENKGMPPKVKSIIFNVGSYRVHLHHWLWGSLALASNLYYNFLPIPQLSYGFLGGLIFQGIYAYSDWHKILIRIKNPNGFD